MLSQKTRAEADAEAVAAPTPTTTAAPADLTGGIGNAAMLEAVLAEPADTQRSSPLEGDAADIGASPMSQEELEAAARSSSESFAAVSAMFLELHQNLEAMTENSRG
jgi:hypothetical protein